MLWPWLGDLTGGITIAPGEGQGTPNLCGVARGMVVRPSNGMAMGHGWGAVAAGPAGRSGHGAVGAVRAGRSIDTVGRGATVVCSGYAAFEAILVTAKAPGLAAHWLGWLGRLGLTWTLPVILLLVAGDLTGSAMEA